MTRRRRQWSVVAVACLCNATTSRAIRMVHNNNMEEDDVIISNEMRVLGLQNRHESHDASQVNNNEASAESATDGESSSDSLENETKPRVSQHENTGISSSEEESDGAAVQVKVFEEGTETIRGSQADKVWRDPRPVAEQVKTYYEAQAHDSSSDESVVNNNSDDGGDERIRSSDLNEQVPVVRKDPRPVSDQVKSYYEYMAQRDSNTNGSKELDHSDESGDSSGEEPDTGSISRQRAVPDESEPEIERASHTEQVEASAVDEEMSSVEDRIETEAVEDHNASTDDVSSAASGEVDDAPTGSKANETETDMHSEHRDIDLDVSLGDREESEMRSQSRLNDTSMESDEAVDSIRNDTSNQGKSVSSNMTNESSVERNETIPDKSSFQTEEADARSVESDDRTEDVNSMTTDTQEPDSAATSATLDESDLKSRKQASIDDNAIDSGLIDDESDAASSEGAGDDQQSDRHEPSKINEEIVLETHTYAYVDDDVIDFDIIDSESGASREQAIGVSAENPASDESRSDSDLRAEPKETNTTGADTHALLSNETIPEKDPVAEDFEEEEAGGIRGNTIIRPQKTTSTQETMTQAGPPDQDKLMDNTGEKNPSSPGGSTASGVPQGGGWGFGMQSAQRNTALPESLTKPPSRIAVTEYHIQDPKKDSAIQSETEINSDGNVVDKNGADKDEIQAPPATTTTDHDESHEEAQSERPSIVADTTTNDGDQSVQSEQKSVNSEFVEGLDDINKFFQSVDPPDELDVGAAGSSIQEVLVGQSVQIVLKRVKLGFQFIKKRLVKLKTKVDEYFSRRTTQDGEVALITREDLKNAADKIKSLGKRAFEGLQELMDDLFANDDDDDDSFDMDNGLDQVRAKIDRLRREQFAPKRPGDNRGAR